MALDQPPGTSERPADARTQLRGVVAEVGAEARNLRENLQDIKAAATAKTDRQTRIREAVRDADPFRIRNSIEIQRGLDEIAAVLRGDPETRSRYGQLATDMANAWERALGKWPKADEIGDQPDVEAVLIQTGECERHLDEMLYRVAQVIVPMQIRHWAEAKRVGDALDFHTRFGGELPTPELRQRFLKWIGDAPGTVPGIVDVETGIIYIASLSSNRRRLTWIRFTIAAAATLATAFFAPAVARWLGETTRIGDLTGLDSLGLYAAVLLGAALHVGVDVLKDARAEKGARIRAVEDFTLWAHVHERQVLFAIFSLVAAHFLYLYFEPRPTVWVALVVGYSWDSAIDILLGRFTTAIDKDIEKLRKDIAPASGA